LITTGNLGRYGKQDFRGCWGKKKGGDRMGRVLRKLTKE
jgi:hypothetical protein